MDSKGRVLVSADKLYMYDANGNQLGASTQAWSVGVLIGGGDYIYLMRNGRIYRISGD